MRRGCHQNCGAILYDNPHPARYLNAKVITNMYQIVNTNLTVAAAYVAAAEAFELKAAHRPGVWAKYAQTPGGSST